MSKTLCIKEYNNEMNIDNDIESLEIDYLIYPLNNLPPSINKIVIKHQENIFIREHRIPFGCELIIEQLEIYNMNIFDKAEEEDYLDITCVKLYNCNLKEIPDKIFKFINLKILYLGSNCISEIPNSITSLCNLQELDLSNNKISEIPIGIASLTNLQCLYLSYNRIKEIHTSIASLANLKYLDICNNQIKEISNWLKEMNIQMFFYD